MIVRVEGFGVGGLLLAHLLKTVLGYRVLATPLGVIGEFRIGGSDCFTDYGIAPNHVYNLLPWRARLALRYHRRFRETPTLYRRIVERLLAHGIPIVSREVGLRARNVIHVYYAVCDDVESIGAERIGDACITHSSPLIARHGNHVYIVPPEEQDAAICEAIKGLGPHTAQHLGDSDPRSLRIPREDASARGV